MSPISDNILGQLNDLVDELTKRKQLDLVDYLQPIYNYVRSQEDYIEELLQELADKKKRR